MAVVQRLYWKRRADYFLDSEYTDTTNTSNYCCSKSAIEKYSPRDDDDGYNNIRSKTHGRLLSIKDGVMRTCSSLNNTTTYNYKNYEEDVEDGGENNVTQGDHSSSVKLVWKNSLNNVQNESVRTPPQTNNTEDEARHKT